MKGGENMIRSRLLLRRQKEEVGDILELTGRLSQEFENPKLDVIRKSRELTGLVMMSNMAYLKLCKALFEYKVDIELAETVLLGQAECPNTARVYDMIELGGMIAEHEECEIMSIAAAMPLVARGVHKIFHDNVTPSSGNRERDLLTLVSARTEVIYQKVVQNKV